MMKEELRTYLEISKLRERLPAFHFVFIKDLALESLLRTMRKHVALHVSSLSKHLIAQLACKGLFPCMAPFVRLGTGQL